MKTFALVAALLVIALSGCSLMSPNSERSGELAIQTDRETYSVEGDYLEIPVALKNSGESSVYVAMEMETPSFFVQKRVEGEWISLGNRNAAILLTTPPRKVEPGQRMSSMLWLSDLRNRALWEIGGPLTGTYRFVLVAAPTKITVPSQRPDDLLPIEKRASRPFEIIE